MHIPILVSSSYKFISLCLVAYLQQCHGYNIMNNIERKKLQASNN